MPVLFTISALCVAVVIAAPLLLKLRAPQPPRGE
jgi:hypothetical protein